MRSKNISLGGWHCPLAPRLQLCVREAFKSICSPPGVARRKVLPLKSEMLSLNVKDMQDTTPSLSTAPAQTTVPARPGLPEDQEQPGHSGQPAARGSQRTVSSLLGCFTTRKVDAEGKTNSGASSPTSSPTETLRVLRRDGRCVAPGETCPCEPLSRRSITLSGSERH